MQKKSKKKNSIHSKFKRTLGASGDVFEGYNHRRHRLAKKKVSPRRIKVDKIKDVEDYKLMNELNRFNVYDEDEDSQK